MNTTTPVKEEQRRKFEAASAKKSVFSDEPGPSNIKKMKTRGKDENKGRKKEDRDYFCTICDEKYVCPPVEDWIQCITCLEWTHEACSDYSGHGPYLCDICMLNPFCPP